MWKKSTAWEEELLNKEIIFIHISLVIKKLKETEKNPDRFNTIVFLPQNGGTMHTLITGTNQPLPLII